MKFDSFPFDTLPKLPVMPVSINEILAFVFDETFEQRKPGISREIREKEMYQVLVNEIKLLKEEHHTVDKVKEVLEKETKKTRTSITGILKKFGS